MTVVTDAVFNGPDPERKKTKGFSIKF